MSDKRYRLDEIADAYRSVETGQKVGNVVIRVDDDDDALSRGERRVSTWVSEHPTASRVRTVGATRVHLVIERAVA